MFFGQGVASQWFATHPALEVRIRRIEPQFQGSFGQTSVIKHSESDIVDPRTLGFQQSIDRDQVGTANSTFPRLAHTDGKFAAVWSDYRNADATYNDLFYNNTPGAEGDVEDDGWTEDDMLVTSALEGQSYTVDHRPVILGDRLLTTWVDGRNGSLDVFFSGVVLGDGVDNLEKLAQAAGVSTDAP